MQADEEDVYHLMDLRERYFVLIGAGSLIEGIAAYFLFFQIRCWDLIEGRIGTRAGSEHYGQYDKKIV